MWFKWLFHSSLFKIPWLENAFHFSRFFSLSGKPASGQQPPRQHPPPPPPGQQAAGTHPTGMFSCVKFCQTSISKSRVEIHWYEFFAVSWSGETVLCEWVLKLLLVEILLSQINALRHVVHSSFFLMMASKSAMEDSIHPWAQYA